MKEKPERIIPRESTETLFHFRSIDEDTYDVFKLIALSTELPVQRLPLDSSEIQLELDTETWDDGKGNKITPRDVINILKQHTDYNKALEIYPELAEHIRKIRDADYSYPVLLFNGSILDGLHRIAKACIEKQDFINAKIFQTIPNEALMGDSKKL